MEALQTLVLGLIHHYGYAGLFVVMVLGNLAIPVGTEFIVPAAGAAAGAGHLSSWLVVGAIATLGEIVGGIILYSIGYVAGEPILHRFGKRGDVELARIHAFFERYGTKTIFICRFVPLVRVIASLPPGVSRMQKRYFFTFHALGSAIFCFALAYLGEALGEHLNEILPAIHRFSLVVAALAVVAIVALLWLRGRASRSRA